MKTKAIILSVMILFVSLYLQADERQDLWLKAAAEKDLTLRLQYFEEFKTKFGQREDKSSKFLYFNLATTAFQLQQFAKAIEYGEKAVTFKDVDGTSMVQLYLLLANSYYLTKMDIDKAFSYAGLVVDFGKTLKKNTEQTAHSEKLSESLDKHFIAPALRIQTRILFSRGKDNPRTVTEAAQKALEAYGFDHSKNSSDLVYRFAYNLSKMGKIDEAITLVEQLDDQSLNGYQMLANWYYKKGAKEKAIEYFDKYYQAHEKDDTVAKTALKIGQLLSKTDKMRAMNYFAEAYVLMDLDKDSKAFKYLQQIYFNEIAKGKPEAEQTQEFNRIIEDAKVRVGRNSP